MFAKSIIDTDAFLELPLSTQALYFHLSMRADDEGFVSKPKSVQRLIRASDDDFKLLIAKRYILIFDTGVIVIKHWKIHNYIRGDRLQKTNYRDEREKLVLQSNGAYTEADGDKTVPIQSLKTLVNTECQSSDSQMSGKCQSSVSIGKDSIGKDSIDKDILSGNPDSESVKEIIDYLNSAIGTRYTTRSKSTNAKIQARLKEGHTIDDFKTVIDNKSAQWKDNAKMRTYLRPETLFAAEHFESYLNEGNINGSGNKVISRTDEEQRNAEIDRYLESDEFKNDNDLPFV